MGASLEKSNRRCRNALSSKFAVVICLIITMNNILRVNGDESHERHLDEESFHEELLVRPLHVRNMIASEFRFTTTTTMATSSGGRQEHFRLFPKSLGAILDEYDVDELHLSLTQGAWGHGSEIVESAPSGVQLWAWFKPNVTRSTTQVDASWTGLCNALSGLFCSSLNFIDATNTVSPLISFRRRGVTSVGGGGGGGVEDPSRFIRYATLPQETVCTENLTPWKKLLPCGASSGLAMLLNARQLFNVHYLSIGIHVRPICKLTVCSLSALELTQTVSMVSEIPSENNNKKSDWSFKKLYDMMLFNDCPVAKSSRVFVDLSSNNTGNYFELSPSPSKILTPTDKINVHLAEYDVKKLTSTFGVLNIAAVYSESSSGRGINFLNSNPNVHLTANRYIKGYGQETGVIETVIRYNHPMKPLTVVYMEQIPSFVVVYSHTLRILSSSQSIKPDYVYIGERVDKSHPFHLEAIITLPPDSVTEISLDFDKTFLKWTGYPPDANHGFYIGPATISTNMHNKSGTSSYLMTLHTNILLVSVPTPDFSMPYNVICLVCTVVALAFGPLHNITTKRLAAVDPDVGANGSGIIKRFINWKRLFLRKLTSSS